MLQIIEQTQEEKIKMYLELPKEKLIEMLINCNNIIATLRPTASVQRSKRVFEILDEMHVNDTAADAGMPPYVTGVDPYRMDKAEESCDECDQVDPKKLAQEFVDEWNRTLPTMYKAYLKDDNAE